MGQAPLLIRSARQLLTLRGSAGPRRGNDLAELGVIHDGAVLIRDGVIEEVGPTRRVANLAAARGSVEIDATGRVVMPGFVDSHTHLIYPPRGEHGADPESAARAMRTWTASLLETRSRPFVEALARHGTTTVEVKTGCGPDEAAEAKALRVVAALQSAPVDVVPTFLLRVPHGSSDEDVRQIVGELAPRIQRRGLAQFVDVWWDDTFSRHELYARFLESAAAFGMGSKLHVEGPGCAMGLALGIGVRAVSVDHLEYVTEDGMRLLSNARTIATLLPAVVLDGRTPPPPVRGLIDQGAAVAIASNFNPHRTPTWSMQTVIAIACSHLAMRPAEAITAATINGAHALGRGSRVGSIEPGKVADLVVLNAGDYNELGLYYGVNLVCTVVKRGAVVYREGELRAAE